MDAEGKTGCWGSAAANDQFGYSVAISGDTIVVGVPMTSASPTKPGSAYVFVRNGMAWLEQQKLPGGMAGDEFGHSVAIQGETLVVGAPHVDLPMLPEAGSAYVFRRSGTVWTQAQPPLKPTPSPVPNPSPILGDLFGTSVAINGNLIAVGSEGDDTPLTRAGAVYVFETTGVGSYVQRPKLFIANGGNGDLFGHSVALEGNTLVAGAPYHTPPMTTPPQTLTPQTARGAAYVFELGAATGTSPPKLVASDGVSGDHFGWSVAVSRNVIAVGARDDDTAAGSAYVFTQGGSGWTQTQKLVLAQRLNGDRFGESVAWSLGNLVVGAAAKPLNPGQGHTISCLPDRFGWLDSALFFWPFS